MDLGSPFQLSLLYENVPMYLLIESVVQLTNLHHLPQAQSGHLINDLESRLAAHFPFSPLFAVVLLLYVLLHPIHVMRNPALVAVPFPKRLNQLLCMLPHYEYLPYQESPQLYHLYRCSAVRRCFLFCFPFKSLPYFSFSARGFFSILVKRHSCSWLLFFFLNVPIFLAKHFI